VNEHVKRRLIAALRSLGLYQTYRTPKSVEARYRPLGNEDRDRLATDLIEYITPEYYSTVAGKANLAELLHQRQDSFRSRHVPFLIETIGLEGRSVLEIGCGVGSFTVALAEQGAIVTALDVDQPATKLCKKRLASYRVTANVVVGNALHLDSLFPGRTWDLIIYSASLEHMTPDERLASLRSALGLLSIGGHLCILGTPNRLWFFDEHTSLLPFYMWLQDEVAIEYRKYSPRPLFSGAELTQDQREAFYRWGRGVSYHEIDLAFGGRDRYRVLGALAIFLRRHGFLQRLSYARSLDARYKTILSKVGPPGLHPAFYENYLDLIIEKL
jgi:S-adenosylmethionine-dependent methyltransferase